MLDLNYFNKNKKGIRKNLGAPNNPAEINNYDIYFNISTGRITGIKDNERNIFYKFNQEDIIQFINMINIKEKHTSEFLQSIELTFKSYIDREIEYYNTIIKLEEENKKLKNELNKIKSEDSLCY